MKKYLFPFHCLLLRSSSRTKCDYFSDAIFKTYLVFKTDSINTNKDTEISVAEAIAFKGEIVIPTKGISSLIGIEAFVNITMLLCYSNPLTDLDISKNIALTYLNCYKK